MNFKYSNNDKKVIDNLTITFEENNLYSIVGYNGCGKSTLLNLLINLYDVKYGNIYIDRKDIKHISVNQLRKSITYIQQKPHIFNGTIKDNLLFLNQDCNNKDLVNACKLANLNDFVESLPNKYDTLIGEMGIHLSGGQAQRLALARAILRKSKVILLDEITSELDGESEFYIMSSLKTLAQHSTIIIISHRLSTVLNADKIYVMNCGKIEDCGTHEELMKSSLTYKNLFATKDTIKDKVVNYT